MPPKGESLIAPTKSPAHHKEPGFNLAELLVVLLLIGLLFGIAWPAGQRLLDQGRLRAAMNEVYTALLWTRNEAVRLQEQTYLCSLNAQNECITQPSLRLGARVDTTPPESIPRAVFELQPPVQLSWSSADAQIQFKKWGELANTADATYIELRLGHHQRQVEVCFNGRVVIRPHLNQSECD